MKRYYLVDFENVGKKFLKGTDQLTAEDTVYLYHAVTRGGNASPDVVNQLNLSKATVKIIPVYRNTLNAMDFEIVAHLGYLIGQNGYQKDYPLVASHFKDVSGLNAVLLNRRKETYKQIMPVWLSMMKYDASAFVYSKERPKTLIKEVSRYEY